MINYLRRLFVFLTRGVWEIELAVLSWPMRVGVRVLRIGNMVFNGFFDDELPIRASALTFASLMSLVPLLAIVFAILNGLGYGAEAIDNFWEWQANMPDQFQSFVEQTLNVARHTNIAALGWVGLGVLLIVAMTVLNNLEVAFNRIWRIGQPRSMLRQAANYISILVVVPLLVGVASTVAATLKSEAFVSQLGVVSVVYWKLLHFMPLVSAWLAFGFLYASLPNTHVSLKAGIISGLVGAIFWLGWQEIYISLQVGVAQRNVIYGTFASVPIFLGWLYISWLLLLLGAEVAFAVQHEEAYLLEKEVGNVSGRLRLTLAMLVLYHAARRLDAGEEPLHVDDIARQEHVSDGWLRDAVEVLVNSGFLAAASNGSERYVLIKAPDRVNLGDVFKALLSYGKVDASVEKIAKPVSLLIQDFEAMLTTHWANKTLRDVVNTPKG